MKQIHCKAIIFDLDGVLVDSSAVVERHWQEWADRHSIDMAVLHPIMHGRRAIETMQIVAPHLDIEAEAARFAAIEVIDNVGLVPVESAASLVQSLPPEKWGVATSGTRAIALARLEAGGIPVPKVLVTADDVQSGKPAPDAYLMAAKLLGVAPEDCIVIEDALAGVAAAVAAGMRVIALTTTHNRDDLGNADFVMDDLPVVTIGDKQLLFET